MADMADRITQNQSKLIVSNVRKVFAQYSIEHLDKRAYTFITLHMGFIAHFNLEGFQREYAKLGRFAVTLLDTETHVIEVGGGRHRNDDWADEVEKRRAPTTAITLRAIRGGARGARAGARMAVGRRVARRRPRVPSTRPSAGTEGSSRPIGPPQKRSANPRAGSRPDRAD